MNLVKQKHIKIKNRFKWNSIKISLILNLQFWLSVIIGDIITYFYFKWYIFNSNFSQVNKSKVIIISILFICTVIVLIVWFPKFTHYIGTYLVVTYTIILLASIFFLIYGGLILWLNAKYSLIVFVILSMLALIAFIVLAIIFFEKVENSMLAQALSIGSFIFLFSTPIILTVIRSQTLAVLVGSFIAFLTHFFLKQLIPYIFSSVYAEDHYLSNINLTYEISSSGKIVIGLIDLLFAYVALAYGIAMYLSKQLLVNVKLESKSSAYKQILTAVSKTYGKKVVPQIDLGTVSYWSEKANNTLLNSFTLIMAVELIVSMIVFAGLYKHLDKSFFSFFVERKALDRTINSHEHRHRPKSF